MSSQIILTLLRAGLQSSRASIDSLRPSTGEGLGGEGIPLGWIKSRNSALDEDLEKTMRSSSGVLAPSPLTPLPRWERGTDVHRVFRETKDLVTIFCKSHLNRQEQQDPKVRGVSAMRGLRLGPVELRMLQSRFSQRVLAFFALWTVRFPGSLKV